MAEEVVAIRLSALGAADVEGAMTRASRATARLNTTTAASGEGARKAGNAIVNLATASVGATGPIGRLAEGVGLMGVGGTVVTAVAAGIAIIYGAYRILGADALAAAKKQDEFTDALARQARDGIPATSRSLRDLSAAMREFEQASERVNNNQSVIDFLNRFGGGDNGDPIARGLAAIVNRIGAIPRGRQREAATAVNQGQINQQQATADLYVREAQLIAETIEVRGKSAESVRRATAMQAFLNAEAQKSIYSIPQQNALLTAAGRITDVLADKRAKGASATRNAAAAVQELVTAEQRLAAAQLAAAGRAAAQEAFDRRDREQRGLTDRFEARFPGFAAEPDFDPLRDAANRTIDRSAGLGSLIDPAVVVPDSAITGIEARLDTMLDGMKGKLAAAGVDLNGILQQGIGDAIFAGIAAIVTGNGDVVLQALGSIFSQMGQSLITSGLAMIGLLPALSNPFTSGPAMLAAGVVLAGLGVALGAAATGGSGGTGRVAGGQGAGSRDITIRIPSSNLRQPSGTPAGSLPVPVGVTYYGGKDPKFERWLTERVAAAQGRGL